MSSFVDLNSLISQRTALQTKLAVLTPGQFQLYDRYTSQLEQLNQQIQSLQQPSVVNIHHYTPTDAEFVQPKPSIPYIQDTKGKSLTTYTPPPREENSLDNTIFLLEEEIKEKEVLVKELWRTLKLQREELEYLKRKRNDDLEKEIFQEEMMAESYENKMIKGIDDRLIISVNIRAAGYLQYTLDAHIDIGAMNSCSKHGAIPEYYWQPIDLSFRAVNKTELKIKHIAPDFPIYIQDQKIPVTFYSFDTGSDILLGQDFVNKCLPMTVGYQFVQLTINGKALKIPSKTVFESRIIEKETTKHLEHSASSLVKIQKIVTNANKHGLDIIKEVKEKIGIRADRTLQTTNIKPQILSIHDYPTVASGEL
jgi:hypothetical protein